jgi:hypothetical protein
MSRTRTRLAFLGWSSRRRTARNGTAKRRWNPIVLLAIFGLAIISGTDSASADEPTNRSCQSCHGQPHIGEAPPDERAMMVAVDPAVPGSDAAVRPELYVPESAFAGTMHAGVLLPLVPSHGGQASPRPDAASGPVRLMPRPAAAEVRRLEPRTGPAGRRPRRADLLDVPRIAPDPARGRSSVTDASAQRRRHLCGLPPPAHDDEHQWNRSGGPHRGISGERARTGGHGGGPDPRRHLRRLPWLPRRPAVKRSAVDGSPDERAGHLRHMPPRGAGGLRDEHPRPAAGGGESGRPGVHRLPRGARDHARDGAGGEPRHRGRVRRVPQHGRARQWEGLVLRHLSPKLPRAGDGAWLGPGGDVLRLPRRTRHPPDERSGVAAVR